MKLPAFLFRLLPLWSYICPRCKREVKRNSHKCPYCGERYGKPLKVPPRFLKSKEALERYVHEKIFPRISAKQREYLAQFFTTIFEDGFESGDFSAWSGTTGSPSVVSDVKYQGSYAAKFSYTSPWQTIRCYKTGLNTNPAFVRTYFRFDTLPPNDGNYFTVLFCEDTGWGDIYEVGIKNVGGNYQLMLHIWRPSNSYYYSENINFQTNTWYCLEVKFYADASNGEYRVWLGGQEKITVTGLNTSGNNLDIVSVGCNSGHLSTLTIWHDCVVVADTYIGEEGEVTEVQVLDSAAGTEVISRPYRFFRLTDTAFGQEVMLKTRNLSLSDVAIGLETLRKARDMGTITDTAQGLEQILKQRLIELLDQAAGFETIVRPTRIIIMADEALSQEIIGKLRELAAITDSAIGMEYISAGKVSESIKTKIFLFIGDLAIQITGD